MTPDPKFTCVCGRECAAPSHVAEPWARLVGYGDGGAVTFHRGEAEAAGEVEGQPPPEAAPRVGDQVWVQIAHPFHFDPEQPVWGLYECPLMVWNGPEPGGDELARSALVRFQILQARTFEAGHGRQKAAALVEVLVVLSLDHLAALPLAPDALNAEDAARLLRDTNSYQHFRDPVRQGDYVYLANFEQESDGGQWAILRQSTEGWELLVAGRWGFDEDLMWAGRVRLSDLPPELEKAMDEVREPPALRPRHPPHGPIVRTKPKTRRFWWGGLAGAVVLGAAGLLGVMAYQADQPMRPSLRGSAQAAFSVDVPADCTMIEDRPGQDFQVFRVMCGGVEYAGVYTGNAPDLALPRSRVTATDYAWPAQVQTWSREVPQDQAKADRISASVSVRAIN